MLQKLLLICSLLLLLNSCKSGPKVTVCVSDPQVGGFDCYNEVTKQSSFLKYADSDKYVAMNPADAQAVFNFCAQGNTAKEDDEFESEFARHILALHGLAKK